MNFKSYPNRKSTASRMARKHMRRDVFVSNKKASKLARKVRRLKQKSLALQEQVE